MQCTHSIGLQVYSFLLIHTLTSTLTLFLFQVHQLSNFISSRYDNVACVIKLYLRTNADAAVTASAGPAPGTDDDDKDAFAADDFGGDLSLDVGGGADAFGFEDEEEGSPTSPSERGVRPSWASKGKENDETGSSRAAARVKATKAKAAKKGVKAKKAPPPTFGKPPAKPAPAAKAPAPSKAGASYLKPTK